MSTNTPNPIIVIGKLVKKTLRRIKRYFRFGFGSYVKDIKLPNTQFQIVIDPSHNACVDETIALQGQWERNITDRLTEFIKPNMTFFDIGANIGYFSLFVASLLKNTGKVHAFEPINKLAEQIKKSVAVNNFNNITIHQVGLGDTEMETSINIRDENMGGSSLFDYKDLNLVTISSIEKISIKTIDSLFTPQTKVDVIKIDVEGYELEALQGARKLLQAQHPVIFMEFSPIFYKQDRSDKTKEMITLLQELGYTFQTIAGEPISLTDWVEQTINPTQIDIICTYSPV